MKERRTRVIVAALLHQQLRRQLVVDDSASHPLRFPSPEKVSTAPESPEFLVSVHVFDLLSVFFFLDDDDNDYVLSQWISSRALDR